MKTFRIIELALIPLLQTGALLVGMRYEQWYILLGFGAFLATDILLVPLIGERRDRGAIFITAFPPLALVAAVCTALFFIEDPFIKTAVIVANALAQCFYLLNLTYYLYRPEKYQESSFHHSILVMHLVSTWLFAIALFGAEYYLDIKPRFLFLPFIGLFVLLLVHILKVYQLTIRDHLLFTISSLVMMAEVLALAHILPNYYLVNSMFVLVLDALIVLVGIASLRREARKGSFRFTIILLILVLLLTLLTAPLR